jgi:lipopolysaccharide transport system ATP-binding protein
MADATDRPRGGGTAADRPAAAGSTEIAATVRDLGKLYRLYDAPQDRLKHMLFWRLGRRYGREFWALRSAAFELYRGEALGIIGKNGSGKSTLLQLMAGILQPTEGVVDVRGRVGALLELGSGFNPEYSGRVNVLTNGAILGIPRQTMERRLDEIAAFADIGQFIDQPVKTYSSGMFVRLAFAVTTAVDSDVLLIDEALAVGDVFFRQRCYQRLLRLRQAGTAIVLVSHAMPEIEQFCDRALLLHEGRVVFLGPAREAVKRYYLLEQEGRTGAGGPLPAPASERSPVVTLAEPPGDWPLAAGLDIAGIHQIANGWARCRAVALSDEHGAPCRVFEQGERACFWYEFEILREIQVPTAGAELVNDKGLIVHGKSTLEDGTPVPERVSSGSRLRVRQDIVLDLAPGEYTFNIGMGALSRQDYERRSRLSHQDLDACLTRVCLLPGVGDFAVVLRRDGQPVQLMHHGVANLAGRCRVTVVPEGRG